jgi:3'-5' exoribonuclease
VPAGTPGRPGGGGRSTSAHHAYLGGLLEHTVAVATLAVELCALHPRLDRDLLIAAAIVHDLGKTREFTYGAEIRQSREGRLLGHIELGMRLVAQRIPAELPQERRLALEHCVLLHHGPDPGPSSPRFASAEALALYRLNALDAHLKGAFELGFPSLHS